MIARERRQRLLALAPYLIAAIACLALAGKPLHIDDGNFVLLAREVRAHPLRAFADGAVRSNPPGHQYLLALIAALFGEGEVAFHLGLLPFTLLAVWAMQRLAERFGVRPAWLPALLAACSPCFLVSASSLMPDVTMLGVILPALVLLFDDERAPHPLRLLGATLLFAVGWLLRFNGLPLLGLGALLSLWRGNRRALLPLLALVGCFAFWVVLGASQPGAPQPLAAAQVAGGAGTGGLLFLRRLLNAASALVLASAVGPAVLLLVPAPGLRRAAELLGAACFAAATVLPSVLLPLVGCALLAVAWVRLPAGGPSPEGPAPAGGPRLLLGLDSDLLFLLLWAASGLLVPLVYNQSAAKFLNLPQPALLLLLVRAAGAREERALARSGLAVAAIALALAVPLAIGDRLQAVACRELIVEQVGRAQASGAARVIIGGTPWGARFYGGRAGATYFGGTFAPGTEDARALRPGDQVIDVSWPGALSLPASDVALLEERAATDAFPIRLMSGGAGYWSSDWGLSPFVFSREPYQRAWRVRVLRAIADQ